VDSDDAQLINVRLPAELAEAFQILRTATGRDDYDIVTSALRTYLADQRQRDTVDVFFQRALSAYPRAYLVSATATFQAGVMIDADTKLRIQRTFDQINRYAPTQLEWSPDARTIKIDMAVSGHNPDQARTTAAKMVRNRIVDELLLGLDETDAIDVLSIEELPQG
jgi:hypothetical protein